MLSGALSSLAPPAALRMFGTERADLRCVEVIQGPGAVHLCYEVVR
jgi:hypothetical protein